MATTVRRQSGGTDRLWCSRGFHFVSTLRLIELSSLDCGGGFLHSWFTQETEVAVHCRTQPESYWYFHSDYRCRDFYLDVIASFLDRI